MKKEYSNGEVTITWEPEKCIHAANCVNGLPGVFQPDQKPWINPKGANTEAIVTQIKKCPSSALGYYFDKQTGLKESSQSPQLVEVIQNGPLMISGNIQVKLPNGKFEDHFKLTAFCRCGSSSNKPFCDGTHKKISFNG